MSEFETKSLLDVEVSRRSLRSAQKTIEDDLGDVTVDIQASTSDPTSASSQLQRSVADRHSRENAMSRQLLSGQSETLSMISGQVDDLLDLAEERNDLLRAMLRENEKGDFTRAKGGGGGGILGGLLGGALTITGISAVAASDLITGALDIGDYILDEGVDIASYIVGEVSARSIITDTVTAASLVSGSVVASELISGTVSATDLIGGEIAIASYVTGAIKAAALVSGTVAIGSLITGMIDISDYIKPPGGGGSSTPDSPSSRPTPTNHPNGAPYITNPHESPAPTGGGGTGDGGWHVPDVGPAEVAIGGAAAYGISRGTQIVSQAGSTAEGAATAAAGIPSSIVAQAAHSGQGPIGKWWHDITGGGGQARMEAMSATPVTQSRTGFVGTATTQGPKENRAKASKRQEDTTVEVTQNIEIRDLRELRRKMERKNRELERRLEKIENMGGGGSARIR